MLGLRGWHERSHIFDQPVSLLASYVCAISVIFFYFFYIFLQTHRWQSVGVFIFITSVHPASQRLLWPRFILNRLSVWLTREPARWPTLLESQKLGCWWCDCTFFDLTILRCSVFCFLVEGVLFPFLDAKCLRVACLFWFTYFFICQIVQLNKTVLFSSKFPKFGWKESP